MTDRIPFTVQILFAEGLAEGLRLIEKSGWVGLGIVCPRRRYSWAKKARDEFSRSGVYLLVGDGDPLPKLYVGEAEKVKARLDRHLTDFAFWHQAIVFTTKGTPLNKAEIKYIEARLLELARKYGRSKLQNTNKPRVPGLSEADQAEMKGYLHELLSLLPVLGVPFFQREEAPSRDHEVYYVERSGCKAAGFETNTGFTVRDGSLARKSTVRSMKEKAPGYYRQRQALISEGVLKKTPEGYRFTRDWLFRSPSAAAAVCLGSNANGLTEWKDGSGVTLKANRKKATA